MEGLGSGLVLIVVGGGIFELDLVPRYKSVIALDSNAGICSNLCFQDPRSSAGSLRQGARAFLEKIESIERFERDDDNFFAAVPAPLFDLVECVDEDACVDDD